MRARVLFAAALAAALGAAARAEDPKVDRQAADRAELDRKIVQAVYETAVLGTDIFNKGNHEGCFRLYQGSLMSLQPMLDHRPKLQGSVKDRLSKARAMKPAEGAFALREALDEIQNEIAPNPKADAGKKTALWDRLGGEKGVQAVVHDVLAIGIEDERVKFLRNKAVKVDIPKLEQAVVAWVSEKTGGPLKFDPKDLKAAYPGGKITLDEYTALGGIMAQRLEKLKVPPDAAKELIDIVTAARGDVVEPKGGM